jgi:hypothetical protein
MNVSAGTGQPVVLAVGGQFHLMLGKDNIIYAGMPSDEVYSIAQRKSNGYQGYAWNLFYPKNRREITIDGVRLYVERVTPDEIAFHLA